MTLAEFRELGGKLYAEQASESLFDLAALFVVNNGARDTLEDDQTRGLPVDPRLPKMRAAASVGQALESYLLELLQSGDPRQKEAAQVVATEYDGLLRSNPAKRPVIQRA